MPTAVGTTARGTEGRTLTAPDRTSPAPDPAPGPREAAPSQAERPHRPRRIDPPEFGVLLAKLRELNAPEVADAAEFAYLTCFRRSNAVGAVWSWFKFELDGAGTVVGGSVRLPGAVTKNRKPLALPLRGALLALVARRWTQRVAECPFVFHRAGRPLGA